MATKPWVINKSPAKQGYFGFIYKIVNKVNNKIYIGQTIQAISKRFKAHLRADYPEKMAIHRAIKKYGKESFYVEILDIANDINELNCKEIFYINQFKSHDYKIGYNVLLGGNSFERTENSEKLRLTNLRAARAKARGVIPANLVKYIEASRGKSVSHQEQERLRNLAPKKKLKAVHKLTGEILFFESASEAARFFKCPNQVISRACLKKRPHHRQYIFDYIG